MQPFVFLHYTQFSYNLSNINEIFRTVIGHNKNYQGKQAWNL